MQTLRYALAATVLSAVAASQAPAQEAAIFREEADSWKATCFTSAGVDEPYCRIMVIYRFPGSAKSANFVQFGPAFDRGSAGFVFATYYGFAPESTVTIKIDENDAWELQTGAQNHTIAPRVLSDEIVQEMREGTSISVSFKLATGIQRTLEYKLAGFRELFPQVEGLLEGKG